MKMLVWAATAAALFAASPVLAQEDQSASQSQEEQARIKKARETTRMAYADSTRYASNSVVDPYTQDRNSRNKGALDIRMSDGH